MSYPSIPEKLTVPIRTPDQRLRVFVSSTLKELADERKVVHQAIQKLRLSPVMFEMGARPHSAQNLYQAYLSQSHIFVGIYWQSYGWIAPGMQISGLEDEYHRAQGKPRLIYIKQPAPDREPGLKQLLERIKNDNNSSYTYFTTTDELQELIENDLVLTLTEYFEAAHAKEQVVGVSGQAVQFNVPVPRNPLIGRENELATACDLLRSDDVALLTLTGPGGTGKSRLAIQIALELHPHFPDGVMLIFLEAIHDPQLVIPTIATTLDVTETTAGVPLIEALKVFLCNKRLLLLLDNFEQVLPAAPMVAELYEACPNMKVLVTSRAPLHLRAERELPIPPLALPPESTSIHPQSLDQYAAVQLFIQRAQAVNPQYPTDDQNLRIIAEICRRLDGLPLAIELASGRSRLLSPSVLLSRLDHRFELLQGGARDLPARQQTMYEAIDWSYSLLTENEKSLLRRLSVFAGGWTIEAAQAICDLAGDDSSYVFEGLERLVDSNILQVIEIENEESRMKIFETIREFALQKLSQNINEESAVRRKHAEYYLDFVEQAEPEMYGGNQLPCLDQLEREIDNLRAALGFSLENEGVEIPLRFCAALFHFWEIRGYLHEGRGWFERSLSQAAGAPPHLRAKCLQGAGYLAYQQTDYLQAKNLHEKSLQLFKALDDQSGVAEELDILGVIERQLGNYSLCVELHNQSLALRRLIDDKYGIAWSLGHLGIIARERGQYQEAAQLLEESLSLSRSQEDRYLTAFALNSLGLVAFYQCEYPRARSLLEEAVTIYRQLNDRLGTSNALQNLGNIAKDQGCFQMANRMYQECLQLKVELGDQGGIAQATTSLAEVAFYQGNFDLAKELVAKSLPIFSKLGIKRGIVYALGIQAYVAVHLGEYEHAQSLAMQTQEIATQIDAPRSIGYMKMVLGLLAYVQGDLLKAESFYYEALEKLQIVNDRRSIAMLRVNLARTVYRMGLLDKARQLLEESLALARELETSWTVGYCLEILGLVEWETGHLDLAHRYFSESLKIFVAQENQHGIMHGFIALAENAVQQDQPLQAVHLFSAAERLRQVMGVVMAEPDRQEYNGFLNSLHHQLNEASFNSVWLEGSSMTIKELLSEIPETEGEYVGAMLAADCLPTLT